MLGGSSDSVSADHDGRESFVWSETVNARREASSANRMRAAAVGVFRC